MSALDELQAELARLRARLDLLERRLDLGAPPTPAPGRFDALVEAVADAFDVTPAELRGERRDPASVLPRHVVMALAQRLYGYSLPRIGRLMRRDATSVLHGVRRVAARMQRDPDFAARLERIAARMRERAA